LAELKNDEHNGHDEENVLWEHDSEQLSEVTLFDAFEPQGMLVAASVSH
jgi:hypothetical protein